MTKEDRLQDINDYVKALDQIASDVQQGHTFKKKAVLGFSQGVATACRWVANGNSSFEHLINWAGAFPPDLDFKAAHRSLKNVSIDILVGDNDEFISQTSFNQHLEHLNGLDLNFRSSVFKGKHDVYQKPLKELLKHVFPV